MWSSTYYFICRQVFLIKISCFVGVVGLVIVENIFTVQIEYTTYLLLILILIKWSSQACKNIVCYVFKLVLAFIRERWIIAIRTQANTRRLLLWSNDIRFYWPSQASAISSAFFWHWPECDDKSRHSTPPKLSQLIDCHCGRAGSSSRGSPKSKSIFCAIFSNSFWRWGGDRF